MLKAVRHEMRKLGPKGKLFLLGLLLVYSVMAAPDALDFVV